MIYEIKHRITGAVLYSTEAISLKDCIVKAVGTGADLTGADLTGADLTGADLTGADLTGADLGGAYLTGADLTGADLRGAYLTGADLTGADLGGAYLRGAYLRGAYLRGADLGGAYLRGAYLRGADLTGADLTGADLTGAYLTGAYLTGAYLRGADLTGAKGVNPHLCTPLLILKDQPGNIRAYKLVTSNGDSPYRSNPIRYKIGEPYSVDDADCDPDIHCGAGINLATLDWCIKEWQEGYRILIAEFTAEDIACIPTATDGKFRVHRCRIVGEKDLVEIGLVKAG